MTTESIAEARLIPLEEFFSDPEFSGASPSPDGTRIAYLAPEGGRRNVWVRGIDQDHADAVCVTHDTRRGVGRYHWTDDPRWLLYEQDTDGNEDWHLYRVDLDAPDEPAVDLTPLPPGSRVVGVDLLEGVPGSILVLMNRRPLYFDYFRVDVASGETTLHLEQPGPGETVLLDPAGLPVFASRLVDGAWHFAAIDPDGRQRPIHTAGGAEHPVGVLPQYVTPDGRGLLLGSYGDGDDLQLIRLDHATGERTVVAAVEGHDLDTLGALDPRLPPILFTRRGSGEVLAARFVGDRGHIEVLDPEFAPVYAQLATLSDGVLGTLSSDEAGRRWIATFLHDREPAVTWIYDHETGESRELFRPYPHLDAADLAPMRAVHFPARDGLPLHGFLTLPVGGRPEALPLVVLVHGGPWAHDSWGYDPQAQFLANRGYAVLHVEFRGSTGYGRRHLTSAVGELARAMHTDLIDAADWAVAEGIADPERIGVYGGSYGGYSALVAVTVTPDHFAAAVDYVGISDLVEFLRSVPEFARPGLVANWYRYGGDPDVPEQHADLLARSPITMVDRIRTPLLVAQGANDARVRQSESDNIVASLRERGIPVEYLLAEDEGHGFENPENRMRLYRAVERHFAAHLGGRSG